jgi:predicted alpha-1,2-mannosidase
MRRGPQELIGHGVLAMVFVLCGVEASANAQTLTANERILGFEASTVTDWTVINSGAGTLSVSTTASQGSRSLAVKAHGSTPVQSAALSSLGSSVANIIRYDIMLPSDLPSLSPYWYGLTQLLVDIPSKNIYSQYIGQVELTGMPVGVWRPITITPTAELMNTLRGTYSDLRFTIVVNSPSNASQPYLIDNLRFSDSPVLVADPANLVNPLLGTTNGGNVFPGAVAPFGMIQFSPITNNANGDITAPGGNYNYNENQLAGFALTAVSGPGCGAAGDVPILPTVGAIDFTTNNSFSHANESARAGGYSLTTDKGIKTDLAATPRSGMARFNFPKTTQANLLFRLTKSPYGGSPYTFNFVNSTEVSGSVTSGNFCGSNVTYMVYFDVLFDRTYTQSGNPSGGNYYVTFDATTNQQVQAKVGLSFVSVANAKANRIAENSAWNLDNIRTATHDAWNKLLTQIKIGGGTADQQVVFYTALYHVLLHPNIVSDSNGQYLGFDNVVHTVTSGHSAQYGTFSGWDIYRSQAQLEALVAPAIASDTAQSMVNDYTQSGRLPKWALNSTETYVMVGDPAAPILAAYYAFGAKNFDTTKALAAMIDQATNTNNDRPGLDYLQSPGYLPSDGSYGPSNFYGPVSTLLEYNTADFSVGAFASALGDSTNATKFINRAQNWRLMFNTASGFMQPRLLSGVWVPGFNPTFDTDFVEGTSWQYTGMVPFNVRGLADAMGGNAQLIDYLDAVLADFHGSSGSHSDLGNEPSLELPWEYDYVGQPWKTQQLNRKIQDQLWPNSPTGWGVGNDDLGAMSSWYVWSALGMYPMVPGKADLALGSPLFTQAIVLLPSGNTLTINAPAAADNAPYVQSLSYNGNAWSNAFAPAAAITSGGTLNYALGTSANTSWATSASAAPPSYPGNGGPAFPSPAGPISSGIAGKCIDVDHGNTINGTKIQIWSCNASNAQNWTVRSDGTLRALGKCMDVANSGTANGTLVQLWDCNGTGAQYWVPQAGGVLLNPESGRCLDDPASSTTDGTQLQIYDCNRTDAQKWNLSTHPKGAVTSGIAGKCMDVNNSGTTDGTKVQIYNCNSTGAQTWTIWSDGTLRAFGKCLDVSGSGTDNHTLVQLYECNNSDAQQWQYRSDYTLYNPHSLRCLDDPGSSTTDGTQLQIYDCNNTNAQRWLLP